MRWRECGWTRTMIEEVSELEVHCLRGGVLVRVAYVGQPIYDTYQGQRGGECHELAQDPRHKHAQTR